MSENPVLAAMEAYKRRHPRKAAEVEARMAQLTLDGVEDSEASLTEVAGQPATGAPDPDREVASEQMPLSDPDANALGKFQRPEDAAETQRIAALRVYPTSGTTRRRVLDYIGKCGHQGATDEEMQDGLNMNPSTQRPRRVELVEGGWIEDSHVRRRTHSNTPAVVWVLTERGRLEWQPVRGVMWEP